MNRGWTEKHIEELVKKYAKGGGGEKLFFEHLFSQNIESSYGSGNFLWVVNIPQILMDYYVNSSFNNNGMWKNPDNMGINDELFKVKQNGIEYPAFWHSGYISLAGEHLNEIFKQYSTQNPLYIYTDDIDVIGINENGEIEQNNSITPIFAISEVNGEKVYHPCNLVLHEYTVAGENYNDDYNVHSYIVSINQNVSEQAIHFYDNFIEDPVARQQRQAYLQKPLFGVLGTCILEVYR